MYSDVNLNEYGYYSLKKLPSDDERETYYRDAYYQNPSGSYSARYTEGELAFFTAKLEQKLLLLGDYLPPKNAGKPPLFLDIGCGEGFAMAFFKKRGFSVLGLDYSDAGVMNHNRDIKDDVIVGDIYRSIDSLQPSRYDVVNMDNALEHVVDPKLLLEKAHRITAENGVVIIKAPNDFSILQRYFWDKGIVTRPNWVAPMDHISYFNKNGLINLCKAALFTCVDFWGDQMIEFSALNPRTNYFLDKTAGRECHLARIELENLFHGISPELTLRLYRALGDMGLGRELIGVFRKTQAA